MTDRATIFIPDISGYTEFASRTALDHSAHIVNELLDLIIESDNLGLTVSEIEGDAVLFYRMGEPISPKAMLEECCAMFRNFHSRLGIIERDTICQCGACQTASNLTLKFVVHYGAIKEISVSRLKRAAGIDLIIAHRLLKNHIPSREYVLATDGYRRASGMAEGDPRFAWQAGGEDYSGIGRVAFAYTTLDALRRDIPPPPKRENYVVATADDALEIEIRAPILDVYQAMINVDALTAWQKDLLRVTRDPVSERIGMRHDCFFPNLSLAITTEHGRFEGPRAVVVEKVLCEELNVAWYDTTTLECVDDGATRRVTSLRFAEDAILPPGFRPQALEVMKRSLEMFKSYCEAQPRLPAY
ncbi:MAG: DUF2652 domain-containing protein [Alphaproteobacteria bacterium]